MKNIPMTIAISAVCLVLFSCTAIRTSLPEQPQNTGVEIGMDKENSLLKKGRALAMTECAECHRYYSPEEYTPEEWDGIIQSKAQRLSLRTDQIDAIDFYFKSESSVSK